MLWESGRRGGRKGPEGASLDVCSHTYVFTHSRVFFQKTRASSECGEQSGVCSMYLRVTVPKRSLGKKHFDCIVIITIQKPWWIVT